MDELRAEDLLFPLTVQQRQELCDCTLEIEAITEELRKPRVLRLQEHRILVEQLWLRLGRSEVTEASGGLNSQGKLGKARGER